MSALVDSLFGVIFIWLGPISNMSHVGSDLSAQIEFLEIEGGTQYEYSSVVDLTHYCLTFFKHQDGLPHISVSLSLLPLTDQLRKAVEELSGDTLTIEIPLGSPVSTPSCSHG